MKPSDTANYLRKIATAIENSKKPDRNLVAKDIKAVLQRLAAEDVVKEILEFFKSNMEKEARADFIIENKDNIISFIEDIKGNKEAAEKWQKHYPDPNWPDLLIKHLKSDGADFFVKYPKYGSIIYTMAESV